jgi:hypothetical protein
VYTPDTWSLIVAGFHKPVTPFCDVVGNDGIALPAHITSEVPKSNTGTTFGSTVTKKSVLVAHCPASGVNVYVPEFLLSTVAELHVPVIPFNDVVGSVGTPDPAQIKLVVPKLNIGMTCEAMVTLNIIELVHDPEVGTNV